jgi:hypothetical protein
VLRQIGKGRETGEHLAVRVAWVLQLSPPSSPLAYLHLATLTASGGESCMGPGVWGESRMGPGGESCRRELHGSWGLGSSPEFHGKILAPGAAHDLFHFVF